MLDLASTLTLYAGGGVAGAFLGKFLFAWLLPHLQPKHDYVGGEHVITINPGYTVTPVDLGAIERREREPL